jgi:hypothetical protein
MTTMARPGVPVGGFKTVGQIVGTNAIADSPEAKVRWPWRWSC